MPIKNFTDLIVWERSMELVVDIYHLTKQFPVDERYGLTSHTRKTSLSLPQNIAEGFRRQRRSLSTYIHHLDIAQGSEGELYTQLDASRRLGYLSTADLEKPFGELREIGKMLNGLIVSLEEHEPSRRAKK